MLKVELDENLGYQKHEDVGYNMGNSWNGSFQKTISTDSIGDVLLKIPRDCNCKFEPKVIPNKLEDAIIGMYAKGMTTSDLAIYILEDL
jgi:transposase-like protein